MRITQRTKGESGRRSGGKYPSVARQVEGMFVQMMLKSMRDAYQKMACSAASTLACIPVCMTADCPTDDGGQRSGACRDDG